MDALAILEEAVIRKGGAIAQDIDAQLEVGILAEGLEEVDISPPADTSWDYEVLEIEMRCAVGCGLLVGESWEAEVLDQFEMKHVADILRNLEILQTEVGQLEEGQFEESEFEEDQLEEGQSEEDQLEKSQAAVASKNTDKWLRFQAASDFETAQVARSQL